MSLQLLLASSSPRRKSILNLAQIDFVTYSPQIDEITFTNKLLAVYNGACQTALGRVITGELAFQKALAAAKVTKSPLILASDTLVMCRGYILGKPKNAAMAKAMFNLLLGRNLNDNENHILSNMHVCDETEEPSSIGQYHQVSTAVCLLIKKELLKQMTLKNEDLKEFQNLSDNYMEAKDYVRLLFVEQAAVYMQANAPLFDKIVDEYISSGACFDKAGAYAVQEQTACLIRKIEGDVYTIMGLPLHAILRKCGNLLPFRKTEIQSTETKQTKINEIKPILHSSQSNIARFNPSFLQQSNTHTSENITEQAVAIRTEANLNTTVKSVEPDLSLSKPISNQSNQALVDSLQGKLRKLNHSSSFANRSIPSFLQENNKK